MQHNKNHFFIIIKAVLFLIFIGSISNVSHAQEIKGLEKYDTTQFKYHSPRKASFYSAVLPGLGQVYNKKYWKVPLVIAGIGGFIYAIKWNNDNYLRFKKAYFQRMNGEIDEFYAQRNVYTPENLIYAKDYYRRNRDLNVLGLAAVYIANIVDATVDAYLFDYDVSQKLSLKFKPAVMYDGFSPNFGLTCSIKLK